MFEDDVRCIVTNLKQISALSVVDGSLLASIKLKHVAINVDERNKVQVSIGRMTHRRFSLTTQEQEAHVHI